MRFEEQVKVPVAQAEAWDFLWQTRRVAACLPGCTAVEEIAPGQRYKAQFADAIGPYKAQFDLAVTVQESQPPERIRLQASGQDKRLGATQQLTLEVALRAVAPRVTVLDVTADVQILGKIAALGQFAIKRKAKDVVQRFGQNVAAELARGAPAPQPPPPLAGGAYPLLSPTPDLPTAHPNPLGLSAPTSPPPSTPPSPSRAEGGWGDRGHSPAPSSLPPPAPPSPLGGRGLGG